MAVYTFKLCAFLGQFELALPERVQKKQEAKKFRICERLQVLSKARPTTAE